MYRTVRIPTDDSSDGVSGAEQDIDLGAALGASVHGLFGANQGGNPWESTTTEAQTDRPKA